jgi:hypothetical protein
LAALSLVPWRFGPHETFIVSIPVSTPDRAVAVQWQHQRLFGRHRGGIERGLARCLGDIGEVGRRREDVP